MPASAAAGSSGQIQYNNSGSLGGFTASGDATINPSTGVVTVQQIHETTTAVNNAASPYTVLSGDAIIRCDASGGAVTINLPAASGTKRELQVKKTDSSGNACTITRAGSDTIDGATTLALSIQYGSARIQDAASGFWDRMLSTQVGGDLSGNAQNATVAKINGNSVPSGAAQHDTFSNACSGGRRRNRLRGRRTV